MFETLKNAFKVKEIRIKIWITLALIFVYRIGCYIPVPGVAGIWDSQLGGGELNYLNIMSMMTGGALQYGSLFAMGIGPYINASIIIQLLTVAIPYLESLSKQGEEGRKKISQYTRYLTLLLAVVQSIGILINFREQFAPADRGTNTYLPLNFILGYETLGGFANFLAYLSVIIIFTAGTCITMWIGERITDYGVSNGISMIIFAGIIATAGQAIVRMFKAWVDTSFDPKQFWVLIIYLAAIVVVFGLIVWVDLAERRIPVQYAKQVKGRKMYGGQSTAIPIKINANGVMPLIFSFSILSFPELIMQMFWPNSAAYGWWRTWLGSTSIYPFYSIVLCILIVFFAFFYSQIQFNPDDISKSIQQNGGFIPGIRPGKPTADYLRKISNRITLFGAIFLAVIALVPSLVFNAISTTAGSGVFSATGLLIVVSVALEFNQQLEAQIMMKNYKGFLK
ncbi:MAG: preprotein translocase subunit SecY [Clostridia bacterium]|nr:preprotein translocase subunit SecY [Clostridia bacterium]